jgi:hypothetical protein
MICIFQIFIQLFEFQSHFEEYFEHSNLIIITVYCIVHTTKLV